MTMLLPHLALCMNMWNLFYIFLSTHASKGYSSIYVIHSFIHSVTVNSGSWISDYALREEKLQLDDNLSPLNLPLL